MGCLRWCLVALTLLVWISGVGLLGLTGYMMVEDMKFQGLTGNQNLDISMMAVSGFIFITGFVGCCGAVLEKPTILKFFFGLILVFLFVQIGIAIYMLVQEKQVENFIKENWNKLSDDTRISVQKKFECCGIPDQNNNNHSSYWHISCVKELASQTRHQDCFNVVKQWGKDNIAIVGSCAGGIALLEIIILLLTVVHIKQLLGKPHGNRVTPIHVQDQFQRQKERQSNAPRRRQVSGGVPTNQQRQAQQQQVHSMAPMDVQDYVDYDENDEDTYEENAGDRRSWAKNDHRQFWRSSAVNKNGRTKR